jgi:protein subunit release factor A
VSAPRRSAPTTSRRTGSRTTGSVTRPTELAEFLDGKIDDLVDALLEDEEQKRLEEASQV